MQADQFLQISFIIMFIVTLLSAFGVIMSKNPIHSILFLVLLFIISTFILISIDAEFLAMLFLVIYVGAIVVLFLFVVMMLNVRIIELDERVISYVPIALFIISMFFTMIFFIISKDFFNNLFISLKKYNQIVDITINNYIIDYQMNNLLYIAHVLYKDYYYIFILNGIILLIAMIGAIVLTLTNKKKSKKQDYYIQTNQDVNKSLRIFL